MKRIFTTLMVAGALLLGSNQANAQCYSAVSLDGVNDYLYSPFSNYTFTNFTLEMWINSADYNPNEHYISLYQNSYLVLGGWGSGGVFNTWTNGLNPIDISSPAANTPATGTWHHVAFVYDGTNQILYIDGVAVTTTATTGTVTSSSASYNQGLVIGARYTQSSQYSNTQFEDIRIWTVARSAAELNANMTTNLTGSETGLVAYYRFEDGPGSNTVTDLTGNGNTLTMFNMDPATDWVSGLSSVQVTDVQNSCSPITWIDGNTYSSDTLGATYTYVGGSANGCDSIVTLDLTINASAQSTDVQTACDSYTWIDGNTYTASNNTATYVMPGGAANGCDSIITLDLTINTVDATVTTNVFDLTANESGATYQWVDCDNNYAAIPGETNQTFTATANGNYAVIVTGANGCTDTSACVAISTISVDEVSLENGIVVAPNPTSGEFTISTLDYAGEVAIEVLDITGKVIFNTKQDLNPASAANIDLSNVANGVYIVNVSDSNQSHSLRIVKK